MTHARSTSHEVGMQRPTSCTCSWACRASHQLLRDPQGCSPLDTHAQMHYNRAQRIPFRKCHVITSAPFCTPVSNAVLRLRKISFEKETSGSTPCARKQHGFTYPTREDIFSRTRQIEMAEIHAAAFGHQRQSGGAAEHLTAHHTTPAIEFATDASTLGGQFAELRPPKRRSRIRRRRAGSAD